MCDCRQRGAIFWTNISRELHKRSRSINIKERVRSIQQHDRGERPEPFTSLHPLIDEWLHVRVTRIREDRSISQRTRPRLTAAQIETDDSFTVNKLYYVVDQVIRFLDDEVVRQCCYKLLYGFVVMLRPEEVVHPAEIALDSQAVNQAIHCRPEGRATIMRARWNEYTLFKGTLTT